MIGAFAILDAVLFHNAGKDMGVCFTIRTIEEPASFIFPDHCYKHIHTPSERSAFSCIRTPSNKVNMNHNGLR